MADLKVYINEPPFICLNSACHRILSNLS